MLGTISFNENEFCNNSDAGLTTQHYSAATPYIYIDNDIDREKLYNCNILLSSAVTDIITHIQRD